LTTSAEQLVAACVAAAEKGADFPTVWRTVLKRHLFVTGLPMQRMIGERALLEVHLISGERIVVGPGPRDYAVADGFGDGTAI